MTETVDNPEATPLELSRACGEMGKLFMATEHSEAAEVCYRNAQVFAPNEQRWPYYSGLLRRNGRVTDAFAQMRPGVTARSPDRR